jgi:hypothetical protein
MAEIVLGIGTSHSPGMTLPADRWGRSRTGDLVDIKRIDFRGNVYSYEELLALRGCDYLVEQNTLSARRAAFARVQESLAKLSQKLAEVRPDVLVVIGDDHMEFFKPDVQPPFAIYFGDTIVNRGLDAKDPDNLNDDLRTIFGGYQPSTDEHYQCESDLAKRIIEQAMDDGLDITASSEEPSGDNGPRGIGHFVGFIYQRILNGQKVDLVPVLLNTYFPPNQPRAARCFELGRSIARAIRAWDTDKTVAIVASGGLTHFAIDEELDQEVLAWLQARDVDSLLGIPEEIFKSGTSEIKNWITALGGLIDTDLQMHLLDYVPCYRSEAGTGVACAGAIWS